MSSRFPASELGHTVLEMVVVLALCGALTVLATPSLSGLLARSRMQGAARELIGELRAARSMAFSEGRCIGFRFEKDGGGWKYTLYSDGDGDGIRSGDITAGIDRPLRAARRMSESWEGLDFGFLDLPRVRKLPPGSGWMGVRDDPVQCGSADIISFSPEGDATSGTLYLTDARDLMMAVVLFGPTVRIRSYRYDTSQEDWVS